MRKIYNCTGHQIRLPNIVRADGIYLFDETGKQYMDLESGVWCTALGHNHRRINRAIKQQIDSIMHAGFCYSHRILEEAATSVLKIARFKKGQCVFLGSGSEAIELARQISAHITHRKRSMTLHDSYLGSYRSVIDRSANWYIFNWEKCMRCPNKNHCQIDCTALQKIPDDISEFIFEPGSASGFVRFPPKSLIQNIVTIVRRIGGKIIANEVTTGIGRVGKWFGHHHYAIEPDMIAMGKGVGNGYPVSITAINHHTINQLEKSPFKYMQSHQNDPLGATIVNEVIKTISADDLISHSWEKGARFLKALRSLIDNVIITDVRGRGLMFAMDICDEKTGDQLFKKLLAKGYIVCNRKSLFRIDPPLIITEDEFIRFIKDFRQILNSC